MAKEEVPTRKLLEKTWIRLDSLSEKSIGKTAVARELGISKYWIDKLILEGTTKLKMRLGLKLDPKEIPHKPEDILKKIDNVVTELKEIPTWKVLKQKTGMTEKVFKKNLAKGKGIAGVFKSYGEWLKINKPNSKNVKLVEDWLKEKTKRKISLRPVNKRLRAKKPKYARVLGEKTYGAPLKFRNLIYEPTLEQGVVFLFGMISEELGFSVEHIDTKFPDCIAKRPVEGRGNKQQPVKIEFEFLSKDYLEHDHPLDDPNVIIVCWEHNWKDCPLEVLELRNLIKGLSKK